MAPQRISIPKMLTSPRFVTMKNNVLRTQFDIFLSLFTVTAIILFDRITKNYFSNLLDPYESLPIIRNVIHMTLVHNTGIAFGLFKDQGVVFIIVPVIAIILWIFNFYFYKNNQGRLSQLYVVAFSMILGGAIGNLIDRICFGHVIDFIDLRFFPVFNIADSAITIGALLVVFKCIPASTR